MKLTVSNWTPYKRNTLVALFSISYASGLTIHTCEYHLWLGFKTVHLPVVGLVQFMNQKSLRQFIRAAEKAVQTYLESQSTAEPAA